jgi:hypothetical protein
MTDLGVELAKKKMGAYVTGTGIVTQRIEGGENNGMYLNCVKFDSEKQANRFFGETGIFGRNVKEAAQKSMLVDPTTGRLRLFFMTHEPMKTYSFDEVFRKMGVE